MDNVSIQLKVADEIKKSGPAVESIVVSKLVEIETTKRSNMLIEALAHLKKERNSLVKINKPDQEVFISPGVPGTFTYSAARNKEITEANDKIKKLEKAIDTALDKNDGGSYAELEKLIPKG